MEKPRWSVVEAQPCENFTIEILFADGTAGVYDARPLLEWHVYEPLRSLPVFMTAHAERGTVAWENGLDVAPERLYDDAVRVRR